MAINKQQKSAPVKITSIEVLTKKILKAAKGSTIYDFKKACFAAMNESEYGAKIC
ncbi:MAG: hypothetical protein JNM14_16395 [Ferruginibacter sp.]|nr:hypothetical protein [Ferruginibacter sp.]